MVGPFFAGRLNRMFPSYALGDTMSVNVILSSAEFKHDKRIPLHE